MKILAAALASIALFGLSSRASARNDFALPVGAWGPGKDKPNCQHLTIIIEQKRVIHKVKQGRGICSIKSLKREDGYIYADHVCKWDKAVPMEFQESPDGDDTGFSILVKSPTHILYNNTSYKPCRNYPRP